MDLYKVLENLALISKMKTCNLGEVKHSENPSISAYLIGIDLWINFSSDIVWLIIEENYIGSPVYEALCS